MCSFSKCQVLNRGQLINIHIFSFVATYLTPKKLVERFFGGVKEFTKPKITSQARKESKMVGCLVILPLITPYNISNLEPVNKSTLTLPLPLPA
jgi:hypothetical protein